jgi:hypothetical protein
MVVVFGVVVAGCVSLSHPSKNNGHEFRYWYLNVDGNALELVPSFVESICRIWRPCELGILRNDLGYPPKNLAERMLGHLLGPQEYLNDRAGSSNQGEINTLSESEVDYCPDYFPRDPKVPPHDRQ